MDKEFLVDQYIEQGKSMADIARENHISKQTVYRLIKKYGISARSLSEARYKALEKGKINGKEKRHINENFFEPHNWSPAMAWVLGLLFADGNLKKNKPEFRLTQRNENDLQKVLKLMGSTHMISSTGKTLYKFEIWNKKIYNDLLNLGLTPAKTRNMKFPQIPPEYLNHFIRGLYDGDGSFYINRFDGVVVSEYRNGSWEFISILATVLQKELGIPITVHKHKKFSTYYIKIRQKLKELVDYLYKNAPETIHFTEKCNNIKNLTA